MTEAEWLAAVSPAAMLTFLQGRVSDRKLRLFSLSCCRLNWDSFPDGTFRQAIEVAEEFVEGRLDEARRITTETAVLDLYEAELNDEKEYIAPPLTDILALLSRHSYLSADAMNCSGSVAHWALGGNIYTNYRQFEAELEAEHTLFVRDIFGNPFRQVSFASSWQTTTAIALACAMYDARDFSAMPILADALQDAGCDNEDILDHCRQPGEHVRGCWVVDLVLGKS